MKQLLALSLVVWLAACGRETAEPAAGDSPPTGAAPLVVFATTYPLAFFAERIGGDAVVVVLATPEGVDPAHWSADAATIARAQAADLLLRHGAGDPAWLDLASLHRDRVVDTTAAVRDGLIARRTARHQHGPEGDHSHGEWAGTTWLDPTLAAAEAEAIAAAMITRRPDEEDGFRTRVAVLRSELAGLDGALARAAARLGATPLLFSHPVYAYLEARYGLNGRSVSWEPDAVPNEVQWRALRELLRDHPARSMLWEAEPLPETVERLTALGVESRVYVPCANRPGTGDWLAVMQANRRALDSVEPVAR